MRMFGFAVAGLWLLMPPSAAVAQRQAGVPMGSAPATPRQRTQPPEPGYHVTAIHRTSIFVRDREASLRLYRDILGMKVYFDNAWDNPGINAVMGTRNETLRATVLEGSGSPLYGKFGIYQLSPAAVAKAGPPERSTRVKAGDAAIVFAVDDIDALVAKIRAAGFPIISPPTTLANNPNYRVQAREMLFRDPDGILVNLVQPPVYKDGPVAAK